MYIIYIDETCIDFLHPFLGIVNINFEDICSPNSQYYHNNNMLSRLLDVIS